MERVPIEPRPDWRSRVESQGMHFHTDGTGAYWDESAYYLFSAGEIEQIERATYSVNEMCLEAVQHVIDRNRFQEYGIPPNLAKWIVHAWDTQELTIYGRFDFAFDGQRPPALLEYNADTPTALLEAAVIQWTWFQDVTKATLTQGFDQFNSIHDRLIEAWRTVLEDSGSGQDGVMYFAGVGLEQSVEDFITLQYLRDAAIQAGWQTLGLNMNQIGWDQRRNQFVDPRNGVMRKVFKLYPWEWMAREQFGEQLLADTTRWWEPPWKMLLSNKALLAILYEMFPNSPYLLPTGFTPRGDAYVRKPLLSREGANVQIVHNGRIMMETEGDYDSGAYVYQDFRPLPNFSGAYPVVGSWMVNGYACGVGVREDSSLITTNTSRFVPHLFRR